MTKRRTIKRFKSYSKATDDDCLVWIPQKKLTTPKKILESHFDRLFLRGRVDEEVHVEGVIIQNDKDAVRVRNTELKPTLLASVYVYDKADPKTRTLLGQVEHFYLDIPAWEHPKLFKVMSATARIIIYFSDKDQGYHYGLSYVDSFQLIPELSEPKLSMYLQMNAQCLTMRQCETGEIVYEDLETRYNEICDELRQQPNDGSREARLWRRYLKDISPITETI